MKKEKISEPIIDNKNNRLVFESIIDMNHKLDIERRYLISDISKCIARKDITDERLRHGKIVKRLMEYEKFIIRIHTDYKNDRMFNRF